MRFGGVVLAITVLSSTVYAAEKTWTRSELLAIADQEAKRLGYDVEQMSVSFDAFNSLWHAHQKGTTSVIHDPDVQVKLRDQDYLAVYYAPMKKWTLGGDLWVFLDLGTGEIIEVIRGQ